MSESEATGDTNPVVSPWILLGIFHLNLAVILLIASETTRFPIFDAPTPNIGMCIGMFVCLLVRSQSFCPLAIAWNRHR